MKNIQWCHVYNFVKPSQLHTASSLLTAKLHVIQHFYTSETQSLSNLCDTQGTVSVFTPFFEVQNWLQLNRGSYVVALCHEN